MRRTIKMLTALLLLCSFTLQSGKPAYEVFNLKGKASSYARILQAAMEADIVLFGEMHDNPICHWLEAELMRDLYAVKKEKLVLGAEMFEADNQKALDSFLAGHYDDKQFKAACRLWPNYKTDYKVLVDFAKENKLPFVASNIPRRYASLVHKRGFEGLDTLSYREKLWMAPLPMAYDSTLSGYAEILKATGGHGGKNLPKAQASKDATMAYFIHKNFTAGNCFLHYNGTYHSNNFQGIVWYLKYFNPKLKIVTIASTEQKNVKVLDVENKAIADFIIAIPESMSKTY
jgi:uncharacterized iron-regulated protein